MIPIGELAALGTACLWSVGSLFFDAAGRRVGPFTLNALRIPLAAVFLSLALLATTHRPVPAGISAAQLAWLGASGLVGLVLGDLCFFTSLVSLGPRRATLLMSVAPVFAAVAAWPILGEALNQSALMGIAITLAGIVWVSSERRTVSAIPRHGSLITGALWGLGGAAGQGLGLVLAKLGTGGQVSALAGTFCRMASAAVMIWVIMAVSGGAPTALRAMRDRRGLLPVLAGAVLGPFLGVWLSLVAVQHVEAGVAATIMATVPILVIPLEAAVHRERPSRRAIVGA